MCVCVFFFGGVVLFSVIRVSIDRGVALKGFAQVLSFFSSVIIVFVFGSVCHV